MNIEYIFSWQKIKLIIF